MKILAIETSCDETAIAILECESEGNNDTDGKSEYVDDSEVPAASFTILSHALISQIEIHREFGGVFPAVAKREHAKNLVPLLGAALEEAEMLHEDTQEFSDDLRSQIGTLLEREADMAEAFIQFITETERPAIDAIAVTYGPGLAPALWVGVNFAQALALAWNMPLVPVNHMEGHFLVGLARSVESAETQKGKTVLEIQSREIPVLGLLISGGHTQLMFMEHWLSYRLLGETRDDAVGEAFDKVARMMDLPYPGGPEISRLAEKVREDAQTEKSGDHRSPEKLFTLPRPMIDSPDFNFSFSGLKTSVLYKIKELTKIEEDSDGENTAGALDDTTKEQLAHEFENAVTDVLMSKTLRALEEASPTTFPQSLVIGGGVSANQHIQREFKKALAEKLPYVELFLPPAGLTGDNAVMIGIAGFYRFLKQEFAEPGTLAADGNLSLSK